METRHIVAYALCAALVLILVAFAVRYASNRRQFRIRQSGRGKSTNAAENAPAE
jgi:cytochrome c biogenesis protein CcdA